MTEIEYTNVSNRCQANFLFKDLSIDMLKNFIDKMKLHVYEPDIDVVVQDEPGLNFYIINSGKVDIIVNGQKIRTLRTGDTFGEIALINNDIRQGTVRTKVRSEIWALDRETFQNTLKDLNSLKYKENCVFIEKVPLFELLNEFQKEILINNLVEHKFDDDTIIIKEGDPGHLLYIVKEGQVKVSSKAAGELRSLGEGEYFGDQALLYECPRTATVTAEGVVECLSLSRKDLDEIFDESLESLLYKNSLRIALEKSETFRFLAKMLEPIINKVQIIPYNSGAVVIQEGTSMKIGVWICVQGKLVQLGNTIAETFDIVGETCGRFFVGESCKKDITADGDSAVGFISTEDICDICEESDWLQIINIYEIIATLQEIQLFKGLTQAKLKSIARALTIKTFMKDDKIVAEGEMGSEFLILKSGSVNIYKESKFLRTQFKNEFFGERSLLQQSSRTATAIAAEDNTECWSLSQEEFKKTIDANIRSQLIQRMRLQDDTVQLDDLNVIKRLGSGAFGDVWLVCHKVTNVVYALKGISRRKISRHQLEDCLNGERNLLLQMDHSGIVKLVKTFKDEHRVYFLLEYIDGLDLCDALPEIDYVSDELAQFYIACLTLALEHLQERNIAHRDLKPENIRIDPDGYVRLIDFGVAKQLKGRTFTIVGSMHYMAPEIIKHKGYNCFVDMWSLGVILYELLACEFPFGNDCDDPMEVYHAIWKEPLEFPDDMKEDPARPIIEQLLDRKPGGRGTPSSLKKHPWFKDINWEDLNCRMMEPEYRPCRAVKPEYRGLLSIQNIDTKVRMRGTINEIMSETEGQLNPWTNIPKASTFSSPANWDADF